MAENGTWIVEWLDGYNLLWMGIRFDDCSHLVAPHAPTVEKPVPTSSYTPNQSPTVMGYETAWEMCLKEKSNHPKEHFRIRNTLTDESVPVTML